MQIAIQAVNLGLTAQVRAYVEYRMFSATRRFAPACELLRITLEEREVIRTGARYRCSAVLNLTPAGQIKISAANDRLYGAIDEAAGRLARGGDHHFVTSRREARGAQRAQTVTGAVGPAPAA